MYLSDNLDITSECFVCTDNKCNDVKHMAQGYTIQLKSHKRFRGIAYLYE